VRARALSGPRKVDVDGPVDTLTPRGRNTRGVVAVGWGEPTQVRGDVPTQGPRVRARRRLGRAGARQRSGGPWPHRPPDFGSPANSRSWSDPTGRVPWLCVPGSPRVCPCRPASRLGRRMPSTGTVRRDAQDVHLPTCPIRTAYVGRSTSRSFSFSITARGGAKAYASASCSTTGAMSRSRSSSNHPTRKELMPQRARIRISLSTRSATDPISE
jgi:hypothetical protein